MKLPSITEDAKRLAKLGAKLGFVLAILCHLVPPEYRVVCETLRNICTGDLQ